MYILGLTAPICWNNAAVLIKDGDLIAAVEEERLNKIKHAPLTLPVKAIKFCLDYASIDMRDIDYIAVGFSSPIKNWAMVSVEEARKMHYNSVFFQLGVLAEYFIGLYKLKGFLKQWSSSGKLPKIVFIPHHISHASSAFRVSGFQQASVLTLDGNGENDSGLLGIGADNKIRTLSRISLHDSLGLLYSCATDILGFRRHSEEGKTMGLAAYGEAVYDLKEVVDIGSKTMRFKDNYEKWLWDNFGSEVKDRHNPTQKQKNLAAYVQKAIEEIGVHLSKKLYEKTKLADFCLAGGVTLNCDMNAKILSGGSVNNIFIQPAAHDAGAALGAALECYARLGFKSDFIMRHAYWGPEYKDEAIEQFLRESKVPYIKSDNIERWAASKLASGEVVGWFQGRMEWGPRALGNRSILANPGIPSMKDIVNLKIKHRENWRPFAPSILEEKASEYLEDSAPSPFMLLTFKVKKEKQKDLIAAMHVDETVRAQTVREDTNPRFYKLIKCFQAQTGIPAVLNTSFNDKGMPLVMEPKDAVQMFISTGMDSLALGNFLISKKDLVGK